MLNKDGTRTGEEGEEWKAARVNIRGSFWNQVLE